LLAISTSDGATVSAVTTYFDLSLPSKKSPSKKSPQMRRVACEHISLCKQRVDRTMASVVVVPSAWRP